VVGNLGSLVYTTTTNSANSGLACETGYGWVCTDGSVYAGLSPDGNKYMYVTRCDLGQSWDGSACSGTRSTPDWGPWYVGTTATSAVTGKSNSAALAAQDPGFRAAKACEDLSENGHTDWYLPSKNELVTVVYANRVAIGNFLTAGELYWESTDYGYIWAWTTSFADSRVDNQNTRNNPHQVRCARRVP
jgi:hypothetical protein